MFTVPFRSSDAVEGIKVDPVRGVVHALFSTGSYEYKGVSRRAIVNLLLNPNMSLGFWMNENVLATKYNDYTRLPISYTV